MNYLLAVASQAAERGTWWPDSWYGRCWVVFGLAAQAAFMARFLVQWIASERRGRSYVPVAFWYLSIVGGVMLLTYAAAWKRDIPTSIGQVTGCVVYVRNLMLLRREGKHLEGLAADGAREQ